MLNFTNLGISNKIINLLDKINITTPTEIQLQSIPVVLSGQDILASSQTGSGKTLAYLLPVIMKIIEKGGKGLVLAPTRELAIQIYSTLTSITAKTNITGAVLIGGESWHKQIKMLQAIPDIIIGTPGRVTDHLTKASLKLTECNFLILDEMDRMLEMGMKEQISAINNFFKVKPQLLMFSATIPSHVLELANKYLVNPKRITIGSATRAAPEIEQEFLEVEDIHKYQTLNVHLNTKEGTAIIFVKTKRGVDKLAKTLQQNGHKADAIHGDLNQNKRNRVITGFRNKKNRILVATDVAARGLDIDHVKLVFNYDLPSCAEDYLHRIGRTGRAGMKGHSISFVSSADKMKLRAIYQLLNHGKSEPRDNSRNAGYRRKSVAKGSLHKRNNREFFDSRQGKEQTALKNRFRKKLPGRANNNSSSNFFSLNK